MRHSALFTIFRRLARAQDGFALILALASITVLGIAGTTVAYYSTSNYTAATHSKNNTSAFALAEAGLNLAYSRLHASSSPTMPSALPSSPVPEIAMDGGWTSYYGALGADGIWRLTGIGHMTNPSGGADIYKYVHGNAIVGGSHSIWNYVYADATFGCTTIGNSVDINVPFYIRGNLCMSNSAHVTGPTLEVGGTITMSSSQNYVDTTHYVDPRGNRFDSGVHVGSGCSGDGGVSYQNPCTAIDRVTSAQIDTQTDHLTKPPLDLATDYATAGPGPMHGCTTGSFPPAFDTDTTMGNSTRTVNIVPKNAPYDCRYYDQAGNLLGQISWDGSTNLTVYGTIFIDGNVAFANQNHVVYSGKATIVTSGQVSMTNLSTLCGVAACDTTWDNTRNLLAFVAGRSCGAGNTETDSVLIDNHSTFQGAIYANCDYAEGNNVTVWGPVIARQLYIQNSTTNFYVPIGIPLPGMPNEIVNQPGSWGG